MFSPAFKVAEPSKAELALGSTAVLKLVEVRSKQELFKRKLIEVEKKCRLTQVMDLRFLRASHIKPWAACVNGEERTDGNNGLLLTPQADLLFDRGWITFEDQGKLVVSSQLPGDVRKRLGLNLKSGRKCGAFSEAQRHYLNHHQELIFDKSFKKVKDPVGELLSME